jgi:hypothetical protein
MKKIYLTAIITSLLMTHHLCVAQTTEKPLFPVVNWVSKDQNDTVTIQNASNSVILVVITVNKASSPNPAGVDVNHCGNVTHIDAGGSAVCTSNNSTYPVSFKSDSATTAASGTYQIKQQ